MPRAKATPLIGLLSIVVEQLAELPGMPEAQHGQTIWSFESGSALE